MRILITLVCVVLFTITAHAQNTNSSTTTGGDTNAAMKAPAKKRGPVFRATKAQVTEAQTMLKTGGMYTGDATGKLDPATRAALKTYQKAQGLRVTGTLNRATLEKMSIELTARQKAM